MAARKWRSSSRSRSTGGFSMLYKERLLECAQHFPSRPPAPTKESNVHPPPRAPPPPPPPHTDCPFPHQTLSGPKKNFKPPPPTGPGQAPIVARGRPEQPTPPPP